MAWWKRKHTPLQTVDLDADRDLEEQREWRRNRFRILVCIDGSEESYEGLQFASEIGRCDECDIILLYVRKIDQDLRSGGLDMRVTRANMLEWDLELPELQYLKRGRDMIIGESELASGWQAISSHRDIHGDPLGDNKIEYRNANGKSIVLKLKTAPDTASGILDQYELGPYNLLIIGRPSRWRGEVRSLLRMSVVQRVAMLSPCSVLVARGRLGKKGFLLCSDGSEQSLDAVRRTAVLAQHCGRPVTLLSVASVDEDRVEVDAKLQSTREMLERMGIEKLETVSEVGDPMQRIVEMGNDFELISVSDARNSRLKLLFTHSVAFGVMGAAASSVLNVK
jgi:nucleotide-binding universal stress UspA family protein